MLRPGPLTLAVAFALIQVTLPQATASLPPCSFGDEPAPMLLEGDLDTALVDTRYRLPANYAPEGLVPVRRAGLDDDRMLREAVVADLGELLRAAGRAGMRFELQSAYRSYAYQQRVFAGWVETVGLEAALRTSARPGHSEHQLGTALDLRSAGGPAPWHLEDWAQTPEGGWLRENGWRFGFVMSYPAGKEEQTCYAYEPWHYRWLGREIAARIDASGLSTREWLWQRLEERND
jgi:D-alanyl-D-alanine carboxypeptidase